MGWLKASSGNKSGVKYILHRRIVPLTIKVKRNDEEAETLLPGATYNSFSCRLLGALPDCRSRCTVEGVPIYVAAVSTVIHPAVAHQDAGRQMSMLNHLGEVHRWT